MESDRTMPAPRLWTSSIRISTDSLDTAVIAAAAAALSLLYTGVIFGIGNNLFHLPVVAGLYNEPQYLDDAFIQSLRHYASGVWMLLGNSTKDLDQAEWLFLVLAYLSRLLCFVGFLCCASLLGIERRHEKIVFSFVICFVSFLNGYSFAGGSGIFLSYFTHSESPTEPRCWRFISARGEGSWRRSPHSARLSSSTPSWRPGLLCRCR